MNLLFHCVMPPKAAKASRIIITVDGILSGIFDGILGSIFDGFLGDIFSGIFATILGDIYSVISASMSPSASFSPALLVSFSPAFCAAFWVAFCAAIWAAFWAAIWAAFCATFSRKTLEMYNRLERDQTKSTVEKVSVALSSQQLWTFQRLSDIEVNGIHPNDITIATEPVLKLLQ